MTTIRIFCGVVERIYFSGPGPMGEILTGDIAGIAPCCCPGEQFPVLSEKILR